MQDVTGININRLKGDRSRVKFTKSTPKRKHRETPAQKAYNKYCDKFNDMYDEWVDVNRLSYPDRWECFAAGYERALRELRG